MRTGQERARRAADAAIREAGPPAIGHTYDESGRNATTTWTIEGTRYEFKYGYDQIGRLSCTTYPVIPQAGSDAVDRLTVGSSYNQHGYLAEVKQSCDDGGEVYWAAKVRNGAGQLERERVGNGVSILPQTRSTPTRPDS